MTESPVVCASASSGKRECLDRDFPMETLRDFPTGTLRDFPTETLCDFPVGTLRDRTFYKKVRFLESQQFKPKTAFTTFDSLFEKSLKLST